MAIHQLQLVCDSSTVANFKQWAQPISDWFRAAGFLDAGDTGQLNGAGNGNWAGVSAVPGSAAYFYEVFKSNDGFTQYYVKVEYGNYSGTNAPTLRFSISTSSNGSGTLNGPFVIGPITTATIAPVPPSTTLQFECDFTYGAGRIGAMLWRNATSNCQQMFAIERSLDSNGNYTNSYVTLWVIGCSNLAVTAAYQATLVFGVGIVPPINNRGMNSVAAFTARPLYLGSSVSTALANSIPIDLCAPLIGFFDNPCTMVGVCSSYDISEGVTFPITVYGSAKTYVPSKANAFSNPLNIGGLFMMTCMRYD